MEDDWGKSLTIFRPLVRILMGSQTEISVIFIEE
jgi:hypothetical protein